MQDLLKENINGITVLKSPNIADCNGVSHAFFTKTGGVSLDEYESLNFRHTGDAPENIRENCVRAARAVKCEYADIIRTKQQHTDLIDVVREWKPGIRIAFDGKTASDGVMTNVPGVCLMGFYADCQLLFFCDPINKAVAAVHSGWRGTAQAIAEKTIKMMAENYGTKPSDLRVAIGPSICQNCFETDKDVYDAMISKFGEKAAEFCVMKGEKYHFDTKALNVWRFIEAGILPENISVSEDCTCCGDEKLYWSHRRDGLKRGVHAGLIAIDKEVQRVEK